VYGQSGIENSDTVQLPTDTGVWTNLEDAQDKTLYAFYTDHFGYVAAFDEVELTNALTLLTDGYYSYGLNKKDTYAVEYWDLENTKFATADVDSSVTSKAAVLNAQGQYVDSATLTRIDAFIYNNANTNADKNQGWERLVGAVGTGTGLTNNHGTGEEAWTNLSALTLDTDGIASLKNVNAQSNKTYTYITSLNGTYVEDNAAALDFKGGSSTSSRLLRDANGTTVMANSSTVYYYVTKDTATKTMTVTTKVGYANSLAVDNLINNLPNIHAAYAAVTVTSAYFNGQNTYPVANAVVIELEKTNSTDTLAFVYSVDSKSQDTVRELSTVTAGVKTPYTITAGGWDAQQYDDIGDSAMTFQLLTMRDGVAVGANPVTDYTASRIFVGQVDADNGVNTRDTSGYVVLADGCYDKTITAGSDVPVLTFKPTSDSAKNTTYEADFAS
jgi:hypothetical protein